MNTRRILALAVIVAISGSSWLAAKQAPGEKPGDSGAPKEPPLTCPVSGKPVSRTTKAFVKYHGGKVFFCCNACKPKFQKETAKYATKANHQLVQTGQAKQTGCPFTGRPLNPDVSATVAGVKVGFCCGGCKAKMAKAAPDKQFELAFGKKSFDKAFKIKPKKKEKEEQSRS